jgi:uncharacterized protein with HEPN domain
LKNKDRSDKLYLEDLLTAMKRIAEYIEGQNFDQFKQDYKTVDAVVRNFEIIGEASKNVSDEIKIINPEIPWKEMYYLRNRVMHEYFGIDYDIIWDVAKNHLSKNSLQIDNILKSLK